MGDSGKPFFLEMFVGDFFGAVHSINLFSVVFFLNVVSDSSSIWFQFWVKQGRLIGQLLCKLRPTFDTWFTGTPLPSFTICAAILTCLVYPNVTRGLCSCEFSCCHMEAGRPSSCNRCRYTSERYCKWYPNKHESGEMTQTWKQTIYSPFGPKRPLSSCKEGTSNSTLSSPQATFYILVFSSVFATRSKKD